MEFLNVLAIRKIAVRKGCTVERTATIKYRHYVQIWDGEGRVVDGATRGTGFTLAQAKRRLEAMPDRLAALQTRRLKPAKSGKVGV